MSTHVTQCIVCQADCYCSNDEHALGCGGDHGEGGCDNPPCIEFCSKACAVELRRRIDEALERYRVAQRYSQATGEFQMRLIAPLVTVLLASACASPILPSPSPVPKPGPSAPAPTPTTPKPVNPEPEPTPTSGPIVLHVVNGTTHAPVWMAELTVDGKDVGTTDRAGHATLTVTYGKSLRLIVYHGEYAPFHEVVTFSASDTTHAVSLASLR